MEIWKDGRNWIMLSPSLIVNGIIVSHRPRSTLFPLRNLLYWNKLERIIFMFKRFWVRFIALVVFPDESLSNRRRMAV